MVKYYNNKNKEERKLEIETLIKNAEDKIESYCKTPQDIKELVDFMSRFYNYSLRNSMLINSQFNGAFAVGSFAFWKEKGFKVKKGEKGIKILVPTKLGDRFENEKGEIVLVSKATKQEKEKIKKGELKIIAGRTVFKQGYVFDISQTNAKNTDLPKIFPNRWLEGKIDNYDVFYNGLVKIAENNNIKIIEAKGELGVAKGVSYTLTKEIAVNKRNSEVQNVKTLLHELTHAKLHRTDNLSEYTKNEKEFQAELTAYTVSKYFGIDTDEYSVNYISEWTKNVELKDKIKLLNEVRETAKEFIEVLENELVNDREYSKEKELSKEIDSSFYKEKKVNYYDKNKLKNIPIKEVCEQLGLELKRGTDNKLWTRIRNENTKSCCINLDKNYWFDFGTGIGGDTIKLVEEVKGLNSKESMEVLAEMFGIDGENLKDNFYLSKKDYRLIGINGERATLNLDLNLENQRIEELEKLDNEYGKSMNELANTDREKFLEIIKDKSIPILIDNKKQFKVLNEKLDNELKQYGRSKDSIVYYGMLEALSEAINKRIDIIDKIGLSDELEKNNIDKIDENDIKEYRNMSKELEVGEVRILKSENKILRENEILDFPKANDIFEYEEMRIGNIKKEYEKENKYYPYNKVKGEIKVSENNIIEFRYDIGCGEFSNLAELLERELSNTNNQYEIKDFLIEQGVRENEKEEQEANFINDNFIYDREELNRERER